MNISYVYNISLQFAYNIVQHKATEYTPAYLNHRRKLAYPHPDDK